MRLGKSSTTCTCLGRVQNKVQDGTRLQLGLCKWPDRTTSAQTLLLFCTTACDADLAVKSQPAPACRTIESLSCHIVVRLLQAQKKGGSIIQRFGYFARPSLPSKICAASWIYKGICKPNICRLDLSRKFTSTAENPKPTTK